MPQAQMSPGRASPLCLYSLKPSGPPLGFQEGPPSYKGERKGWTVALNHVPCAARAQAPCCRGHVEVPPSME